MKMIREGMQDYEYLHKLVTLGDTAFANMELAKVVTNAGDFTSDPAVLEQARLDMAAEIEKDLMVSSDAGAGDSGAGDASPDGARSVDSGPAKDASYDGSIQEKGPVSDAGCGCNLENGPTSPGTLLLLGLAALTAKTRRARRQWTPPRPPLLTQGASPRDARSDGRPSG
jgi:MYXO-CTERM domain-containing protein